MKHHIHEVRVELCLVVICLRTELDYHTGNAMSTHILNQIKENSISLAIRTRRARLPCQHIPFRTNVIPRIVFI